MDLREKIIGEAFGEVTALFMSNPLPGTEQIMPTRELEDILDRTLSRMRGDKN